MKKTWTKPAILKIDNGSIKGGTSAAPFPYEAYVFSSGSGYYYGGSGNCGTNTNPTAGGGVCTSFTATSFYTFSTGTNTAKVAACNGVVAFTACS